MTFKKICGGSNCRREIHWNNFARVFTNTDGSPHYCDYKPAPKYIRLQLEELRELKRYVDERLADSSLENASQHKATQASIAELKVLLSGYNKDMRTAMRERY